LEDEIIQGLVSSMGFDIEAGLLRKWVEDLAISKRYLGSLTAILYI
jgi:hypothetical protein